LGNLDAAYWAIGGWFTGMEEYKYLFWAGDQCACPIGFQILNVIIHLQFSAAEVPITFQIVVDQEDGIWIDPCWWPGEIDCVSQVYEVTIDFPGHYAISIPLLDPEPCPCSFMYWPTPVPGYPWGPYLISVYFPELFSASLITDNSPTPCTVYNDWGSGWYDLYDQGFSIYGDVLIYAEANCCEYPITAEEHTWGSVKGLYR
jgi:hypothetical protein